jgi:hypothetical protein
MAPPVPAWWGRSASLGAFGAWVALRGAGGQLDFAGLGHPSFAGGGRSGVASVGGAATGKSSRRSGGTSSAQRGGRGGTDRDHASPGRGGPRLAGGPRQGFQGAHQGSRARTAPLVTPTTGQRPGGGISGTSRLASDLVPFTPGRVGLLVLPFELIGVVIKCPAHHGIYTD